MKMENSLQGKLLVATPAMMDPFFEKSVIYIWQHDPSGAMGFIINQEIKDVSPRMIFDMMNIAPSRNANKMGVCLGGPVEAQRGFVLHSTDYFTNNFVDKAHGVAMSSNLAILEDIAHGKGPAHSLFVLGYAHWTPGQLEVELHDNSWIVIEKDSDYIFNDNLTFKWSQAIEQLGINQATYSPFAGNA